MEKKEGEKAWCVNLTSKRNEIAGTCTVYWTYGFNLLREMYFLQRGYVYSVKRESIIVCIKCVGQQKSIQDLHKIRIHSLWSIIMNERGVEHMHYASKGQTVRSTIQKNKAVRWELCLLVLTHCHSSIPEQEVGATAVMGQMNPT